MTGFYNIDINNRWLASIYTCQRVGIFESCQEHAALFCVPAYWVMATQDYLCM